MWGRKKKIDRHTKVNWEDFSELDHWARLEYGDQAETLSVIDLYEKKRKKEIEEQEKEEKEKKEREERKLSFLKRVRPFSKLKTFKCEKCLGTDKKVIFKQIHTINIFDYEYLWFDHFEVTCTTCGNFCGYYRTADNKEKVACDSCGHEL